MTTLAPAGNAEVRRQLAGPLAVSVVADSLDLLDEEPGVVLGWYDEIVGAVDRISAGGEVGQPAREAMAALGQHVGGTIGMGDGLLADATGTLTPAEVVSNAAVMMFGGIETSEGMTTTLFWHLLTNADQPGRAARPIGSLGANAVEESLRLEPAAGRVDRYATADVELAGASIAGGDLVIVSLTAANRDPATFPDPDTFDITGRTRGRISRSPRDRTPASAATSPGSRARPRSKRRSTAGRTCASTRPRRRRPASSSASRSRCRSCGRPDAAARNRGRT